MSHVFSFPSRHSPSHSLPSPPLFLSTSISLSISHTHTYTQFYCLSLCPPFFSSRSLPPLSAPLQTGPLRPRENLSSPGLGALIWPALGNQARCGDSRVQGGFCQGPVHVDSPAGGGLPQRRRAHQGGHHGYRFSHCATPTTFLWCLPHSSSTYELTTLILFLTFRQHKQMATSQAS